MINFKQINRLSGWGVFIIALTTYLLTLEPSVSFWDCGEFIACSDKLQVGHPPGAPLYLMLGRLFAILAPDTTKIALYVNSLSALSSALTVMFLFWTITHLARKLMAQKIDETPSLGNTIGVIGAGVVGSLAFAFSDSFWFSAVEAEVYAMSSLFTAFVFWAILKWEEQADEPYANRWLVLIAYATGLSLGVHLLNLLAIPAIVLVVYFKKYKFSYKGLLSAISISLLILLGVLKFVLSGLLTLASKVELLFVNSFGWHYNSGLLFFIVILFASLIFAIYWTYKRRKVLLHTILLSFTVVLIGFSSYAMIIIRAHSLTPMNNKEATNVFSLMFYLNREQYGQTPLLKGPYFNAPLKEGEDAITMGKGEYTFLDGKYQITALDYDYNYKEEYTTFFPRMYSPDRLHKYGYEQWTGVRSNQKEPPSFLENLTFLFSYQLNHMYFRYFMWNFSGRQNREQGHGSLSSGNWITGIPFLDAVRFGEQSKLPEFMKNDPARNEYYMLPFILGLLGMFYQFNKKRKRDFVVTFSLFFLTGLAIVLYLNQPPYQPRERDYAYVGSFYAFSIWIGLGVLALQQFLVRMMPTKNAAILASLFSFLFVPGLMAQQNWDDHDRSGRYWAHDIGQDYLISANDKNSILFCYGDNDSFPLWYNQDVEGFRTDIRVCNLSYLQSVWFIAQMQRKSYESDPMPMTMTRDKYRDGVRDQILFMKTGQTAQLEQNGGIDLKTAVDVILDDKYLAETISGRKMGQFITNHFKLPVNKENVKKNNLVPSEYQDLIEDEIFWNLGNENAMYKGQLAWYDALAHNDWKRTFYFASTIGEDNMQGLQDYTMSTGLASKIVPINTHKKDSRFLDVDTDQMYENIMNNFKWGNIASLDVFLDDTNLHAAYNMFSSVSDLINNLLYKRDDKRALKVLDLLVEKIPYEKMRYFEGVGRGYRDMWINTAGQYLLAGNQEKAKQILTKVTKDILAMQEYYDSMSVEMQQRYSTEIMRLNATLEKLSSLYDSGEKKESKEKDKTEDKTA